MKSEHSVVSYKVDLVLALSLLSLEEESHLIRRTKTRLSKFQDSGFLDTHENMFGGEGREIGNEDATESELTEIQMRILADFSDDEDDETFLDQKAKKSEFELKMREDALLRKLINDQIRIKEEVSDPGGGGGLGGDLGGGPGSDPGGGGGQEDPPTPSATPNPKSKQPPNQRAFETSLEERKPNIEELSSVKQEKCSKQTGSIFCRICYSKFTDISEQIEHEKNVHGCSEEDQVSLNLTKEEFNFSCKLCPLKFLTKYCLEIHSTELHKPTQQPGSHKCKLCYKLFTKPYGLRCHEVKYHKNEQQYLSIQITEKLLSINCPKCELKFVTTNSLEIHTDHRHGEGECKLCYKNVSHDMRRHLQQAHKDDKEYWDREIKPSELKYVCQICNTKFVKESILKKHTRIKHTRIPGVVTSVSCRLCYKEMARINDLKRHENVAHKEHRHFLDRPIDPSELKFACDICSKRFVTGGIMQKHKYECETAANFICKLCHKKVKRLNEKKHNNNHARKGEKKYLGRDLEDWELEYQCKICNKKFVTENILEDHVVNHDMMEHEYLKQECLIPKKGRSYFKCKFCYSEFDRFSVFIKHILAAHKSDKTLLREKISQAECKFGCPNCIQAFITKDVLDYHMSKQHGSSEKNPIDINARLIKCDSCPSSFKLHRSLRHHKLKIHNTRIAAHLEDNLAAFCKLCYKQFSRVDILSVHIRNIHKTTEEKEALEMKVIPEEVLTHACTLCDKKFLTGDILNLHALQLHKVGTGQKRFECSKCKERFKWHRSLRVHSIKAHNIKIKVWDNPGVSCKLCYTKYARDDNLSSHTRKIHTSPEEQKALKEAHIEETSLQHQCNMCDKKFLFGKILDYHKQKLHTGGGSLYCKLCQVEFESATKCRHHVHNVHRTNPQEMFALKAPNIDGLWDVPCNHCEQKFMNTHVRNYHTAVLHKKELKESTQCPLCKTEYKSSKTQREHIRHFHQNCPEEMEAMNTGSKTLSLLKCKFCKDNFLNLHILNYHVQNMHREEKRSQPWNCPYCDHTIPGPDKNLSAKMKSHMRSAHQIEGIDTLGSRIVQAEPDDSIKNFMLMMQTMSEEKS